MPNEWRLSFRRHSAPEIRRSLQARPPAKNHPARAHGGARTLLRSLWLHSRIRGPLAWATVGHANRDRRLAAKQNPCPAFRTGVTEQRSLFHLGEDNNQRVQRQRLDQRQAENQRELNARTGG